MSIINKKITNVPIAQFETNIAAPLASLTLPLSPVQSFNGYDGPWPGGAGKNKLEVTLTERTVNGVTFTKNADGTISATGTATANAGTDVSSSTPPPGTYTLNGNTEGASSSTYRMRYRIDGERWVYRNSTDDSADITLDGSQTFELVIDVISGQTVSGVLWKPMLRLATEIDPTFEPYENICPISGWDGANVTRAGKNLLPPAASMNPTTAAGVTWMPAENGWVTVTGTPTSTSSRNYNHMVLPPGTYVISCIPDTASTSVTAAAFVVSKNQYGSSGAIVSGRSDGERTRTFTLEEETDVYLRLYVYAAAGEITDYVFKPMIRLFTESDTWEQHKSTTYPVTWTSAGTVYNGEVDIVSGALTVETMMVTLTGEESAAIYRWDAYSLTVPGLVDVNDEVNVIACSHTGTFITGLRMSVTSTTDEYPVAVCTSAGPRIRFRNREAGNTLEEYRAYLQAQNSAGTPVQVVARLASPQTYQLTPTQVLTLLGVNNVWSDTGNITLEYLFRVFDIIRVKINGTDITDYIAFQGLKRGRNDVESPNAGRTLDAVMHRGRVATKLRWDVTCRPLTSQELSILENLIMPETVNVTIEGDPYYDTWTRRCYANNTSASYLILKPDGRQLWGGITFPIIEV